MPASRGSIPVFLALVLGACGDDGTPLPPSGPSFSIAGEPAFVLLKKIGAEGTYSFGLAASTGALPAGNPATIPEGTWTRVWEATSAAEPTAAFSLTEILGPTQQVDSIYYTRLVRNAAGILEEAGQTRVVGSPTATFDVDYDHGAYVQVFNSTMEPPPPTSCGKCEGKVTSLTLRNNGPAGQVEAIQKKDRRVIFSGFVGAGEAFSFVGMDKKGTMGTEIHLYVGGQLATKIHTSCSQPIGPGLVSGDFEVLAGSSLKGGTLCPIALPPTADCDFCLGNEKPAALTMEYTGEGCVATSHTQDVSKVTCTGDPLNEELVRILVTDKSNPLDAKAKVFHNGLVPLGGTFAIDARGAGQSRLQSETWAHVLATDGRVLQSVRFHTSCSQPLNNRDQFGSLLLVAFTPEA